MERLKFISCTHVSHEVEIVASSVGQLRVEKDYLCCISGKSEPFLKLGFDAIVWTMVLLSEKQNFIFSSYWSAVHLLAFDSVD